MRHLPIIEQETARTVAVLVYAATMRASHRVGEETGLHRTNTAWFASDHLAAGLSELGRMLGAGNLLLRIIKPVSSCEVS